MFAKYFCFQIVNSFFATCSLHTKVQSYSSICMRKITFEVGLPKPGNSRQGTNIITCLTTFWPTFCESLAICYLLA